MRSRCLQVGSVEGRVAVHHVEESMQSKNFTFKCHRTATTCMQSTPSSSTLSESLTPMVPFLS